MIKIISVWKKKPALYKVPAGKVLAEVVDITTDPETGKKKSQTMHLIINKDQV